MWKYFGCGHLLTITSITANDTWTHFCDLSSSIPDQPVVLGYDVNIFLYGGYNQQGRREDEFWAYDGDVSMAQDNIPRIFHASLSLMDYKIHPSFLLAVDSIHIYCVLKQSVKSIDENKTWVILLNNQARQPPGIALGKGIIHSGKMHMIGGDEFKTFTNSYSNSMYTVDLGERIKPKPSFPYVWCQLKKIQVEEIGQIKMLQQKKRK